MRRLSYGCFLRRQEDTYDNGNRGRPLTGQRRAEARGCHGRGLQREYHLKTENGAPGHAVFLSEWVATIHTPYPQLDVNGTRGHRVDDGTEEGVCNQEQKPTTMKAYRAPLGSKNLPGRVGRRKVLDPKWRQIEIMCMTCIYHVADHGWTSVLDHSKGALGTHRASAGQSRRERGVSNGTRGIVRRPQAANRQ